MKLCSCCCAEWNGCGKRLCERHIEHHYSKNGSEVNGFHCRHNKDKISNESDLRRTGEFSVTNDEFSIKKNVPNYKGKKGVKTNCGR